MKERGNSTLRRLDRWVGVPLIAVLGLLRFQRPRPVAMLAAGPGAAAASRPVVTLLKSAAIGDTVMLSAVVRDLRSALPGARIRLACGTSNAAVAKMVEGVDEVVTLPMSQPASLFRMRDRLRSDIFIDFDSWPRINALLTFLSRSPVTIGFRTPGQHRHALYTHVVDHSTRRHEVENYRALIQPLVAIAGAATESRARPWLRLGAAQSADPTATAAARPIVFHMFAGGSQAAFKEWPAPRWAELARELLARGYAVRLSGGPADAARNDAFIRTADLAGDIASLPVTDLDTLSARLRSAAAVVSVDTGIAHLAGAAGARTLALHGPTSPSRWGALGDTVRYLKDDQAPWIELGFEVSPSGSAVRLSVERVLQALSGFALPAETDVQ